MNLCIYELTQSPFEKRFVVISLDPKQHLRSYCRRVMMFGGPFNQCSIDVEISTVGGRPYYGGQRAIFRKDLVDLDRPRNLD